MSALNSLATLFVNHDRPPPSFGCVDEVCYNFVNTVGYFATYAACFVTGPKETPSGVREFDFAIAAIAANCLTSLALDVG